MKRSWKTARCRVSGACPFRILGVIAASVVGLHRHRFGHLLHFHRRGALQDLSRAALVPGRQVKNDDEGHSGMGRDVLQQAQQGLQPARRRADADGREIQRTRHKPGFLPFGRDRGRRLGHGSPAPKTTIIAQIASWRGCSRRRRKHRCAHRERAFKPPRCEPPRCGLPAWPLTRRPAWDFNDVSCRASDDKFDQERAHRGMPCLKEKESP